MAEAICQQARIAGLLGNWQQARKQYLEALACIPGYPNALLGLAEIDLQLQNIPGSRSWIQLLLQQKPAEIAHLNRLGHLFYALQEYYQACQMYRASLQKQPEQADILAQLGACWLRLGQAAKAVLCLQMALEWLPGVPEYRHNLAQACEQLGRRAEAYHQYELLLADYPGYANAWNSLANLLRDQKDFARAEAAYRQSLYFEPDQVLVKANLAALYREVGQLGEAQRYYEQVIRAQPQNPLWQLALHNLCPSVQLSQADSQSWREQWLTAIRRQDPVDLHRFLAGLEYTNAYVPIEMVYQGYADLRLLRETYAELFLATAEMPGELRSSEKPRAAVLVTAGHEGVFLRCCGDWLRMWQSQQMELFLLAPAGSVAFLQARIDNLYLHCRPLAGTFAGILQQLRQLRLALIYYWEVGTDTLNYFLPFFRPAPLQLTSLGLAATSGISRLDGFILGPPVARHHYDMTEPIYHLAEIPLAIAPPVAMSRRERSDFQLPEGWHLYLCPHNLLKFSPDFDPLLAGVLRCDPKGHVLCIQSRIPEQRRRLEQRWRMTIPDCLSRIHWLPTLSASDFYAVMACADVILDSPCFGSGVILYEALALGTPVVALDVPHLSTGAIVSGVEQLLGDGMLCLSGPEAYIEQAVRLATDSGFRDGWLTRVADVIPALYRPRAVAQAFENLFLDLFLTKT